MAFIMAIFQVVGTGPIFGQSGELLAGSIDAIHTIRNLYDSVPDFRPSVQVDDSTLLGCRGPCLHALDDNTIYAVLQSGVSNSMLRYIRFTKSNDTGKTWLNPNIVIRYDPDIIILWPSLAVCPDGDLNVVWSEPYDNGILFSRSTDGGSTWSDTVRVDDALPSGYRRYHPDITSPGDTLFACWDEGPQSGGSTYHPWIAISTDNGATWFQETEITCVPPNNPAYMHRPYIRFDPAIKRTYVMWACEDGEVYVARSSDGVSWQASIATIDNSVDAKYSSMAVGPDGTVYVVWTEARYGQYDTDIFLSRSTDGGVTWSNSVLVNDRAGIGANQYEPHIAIDRKGYIHVSWIECIPFGSMTNAYYTISTDNGTTWYEPNLTVTDIPYTITPSVPYSISVTSDTASYGYVGWVYRFDSVTLNFFSTNCPEYVKVADDIISTPTKEKFEILPNPFSGRLKILFDCGKVSEGTEVEIFDVTGKLIKRFDHLDHQSGQITWDGKDTGGKEVPEGLYLIRFKTPDCTETIKSVLMR